MTRAALTFAAAVLAFALGAVLAARGLALVEVVVVSAPALYVAAVLADVLGRELDTRRRTRRRITDLGGKL